MGDDEYGPLGECGGEELGGSFPGSSGLSGQDLDLIGRLDHGTLGGRGGEGEVMDCLQLLEQRVVSSLTLQKEGERKRVGGR